MTARVLMLLVIPGHLVFTFGIRFMNAGHTSLTPMFLFFYLMAAVIQVSLTFYLLPFLFYFSIFILFSNMLCYYIVLTFFRNISATLVT